MHLQHFFVFVSFIFFLNVVFFWLMYSCYFCNIRSEFLDLLQSVALFIFLFQRNILGFFGNLTEFFTCFCWKFVVLCFYIYLFSHFFVLRQSLESALRHPGDNRTQIRELGQTLVDGGILDELISEKLEAFNSQYEQLNHQVGHFFISTEANVTCTCNCYCKGKHPSCIYMRFWKIILKNTSEGF